MTEGKAKEILYSMWENGEVPPNFTEDHSEYSRAIEQLMVHGEICWEDFF